MADSDRDLYSFLRSRDRPGSNGDEETTQDDGPEGSGAREENPPDPEVNVVDSFGDLDPSEARADADLEFGDDDLPDKLGDLPKETLNEAPFGIVRVDDSGVVQFYNQYESDMSGVDPEDAVGRNFFTELAPCSSNRLFRGRFRRGVREGGLDERFTYTFTYKMSPTLVDVRMHRDDDSQNWLLIRKR